MQNHGYKMTGEREKNVRKTNLLFYDYFFSEEKQEKLFFCNLQRK